MVSRMSRPARRSAKKRVSFKGDRGLGTGDSDILCLLVMRSPVPRPLSAEIMDDGFGQGFGRVVFGMNGYAHAVFPERGRGDGADRRGARMLENTLLFLR